MKKVLIFSHEFPPFIGGVGTVAKQLAEWFVKNDVDVDVLTRKQDGLTKVNGVNFHEVDVMNKLWFLSYKKYIKNNIALDEYDLIILNEAAPTISAGMFFDPTALSKCLVYVHGLEIEQIYNNRFSNFPRQVFGFKIFHRRAVKGCKKLISVGNHMKNKFLNGCNISGLESRTDIILAGVDSSIFKKIEVEKKYKSTFNLVSASRVVREKGYFEKLDIFQTLVTSGLNIHWVICGDGDDLPELKEEVKKRNLNDYISFKGYCTREELNTTYNQSDLFWLLSNYDEALPLVYVEAQMSGIPAIGWNRGGTRDTIDNTLSGFLVRDSHDCINKITGIYRKEYTLNQSEILAYASNFDMHHTLNKLSKYL